MFERIKKWLGNDSSEPVGGQPAKGVTQTGWMLESVVDGLAEEAAVEKQLDDDLKMLKWLYENITTLTMDEIDALCEEYYDRNRIVNEPLSSTICIGTVHPREQIQTLLAREITERVEKGIEEKRMLELAR